MLICIHLPQHFTDCASRKMSLIFLKNWGFSCLFRSVFLTHRSPTCITMSCSWPQALCAIDAHTKCLSKNGEEAKQRQQLQLGLGQGRDSHQPGWEAQGGVSWFPGITGTTPWDKPSTEAPEHCVHTTTAGALTVFQRASQAPCYCSLGISGMCVRGWGVSRAGCWAGTHPLGCPKRLLLHHCPGMQCPGMLQRSELLSSGCSPGQQRSLHAWGLQGQRLPGENKACLGKNTDSCGLWQPGITFSSWGDVLLCTCAAHLVSLSRHWHCCSFSSQKRLCLLLSVTALLFPSS